MSEKATAIARKIATTLKVSEITASKMPEITFIAHSPTPRWEDVDRYQYLPPEAGHGRWGF